MENSKNAIIEQITINKGKFKYYNETKLNNLYRSIASTEITRAIDSIPLLISINHPDLPGYVHTDSMPTGLFGYFPPVATVNYIRVKAPSFDAKTYNTATPFIEALALMGSVSSIAYNKDSDLDFWVCGYEKKATEEQLKNFRAKLKMIEEWIAATYNLEVHFYFNDIDNVKRNIFDSNEDDITGTTFGTLLKDEFYRSSIILKGKIPFWWVTPSGASDQEYEQWVGVMRSSEHADSFIDLGNITMVSKENFLGAGIFQIIKSLGSPFKSLLKIGLVQRYLLDKNYIDTPFLSDIIKRNVLDGRINTGDIDPYIILFNHVHDFYATTMKNREAAELLERCFYLKVDPLLTEHLSKKGAEKPSEKIQIMSGYAQEWGWPPSLIKQMDDFQSWDIIAIKNLISGINKNILESFKVIIKNIELSKTKKIFSDQELKSLTRKIFSHFAVIDNKVSPPITFKDNQFERLLIIESMRDKAGTEFWVLSKRVITRDLPIKLFIHKEKTFIGVIAWICTNRLYMKNITRVEIKTGLQLTDKNFVQDLLDEMSQYFSVNRITLQNRYFLTDPFPILNLVIINLNSKYAKGIDDIFYLYYNSWGETVYENYRSEIDFCQIFIKLLNGAISIKNEYDRSIKMISTYPYQASKEFRNINADLRDLYNFFVNDADEKAHDVIKRYVTVIANTFVVFTKFWSREGKKVICNIYESELKLLIGIGGNIGAGKVMMISRHVPALNYLRLIAENFKPGAVQIYFQIETKYSYFFVSDERGTIIFFRKNMQHFIDYLARLLAFTQNQTNLALRNNPNSPLAQSAKRLELYRLDRDINNNARITEINPEVDRNIREAVKNIVPLTLSISLLDSGEFGYRFSLPDGSYSSIFKQDEIAEVARDMMVLIANGIGYNYYVSAIEMVDITLKMYVDATTFAFTEKNRFELLFERGFEKVRR